MSMQLIPTMASISDLPLPYWLAPFGGVLALLTAKAFHGSVMKMSEGDENMIQIAQAVRDGAMAYLTRQYKVVAGVFVALIIFLGLMYVMGLQSQWALIGVPVAGIFSGLCGWFGMRMATNASARTTFAAKQSLNEGLKVAFRSGAVMGLVVVGFALLDVSFWFFVFNATGLAGDLAGLTTVMLSFGMGASTQALFARVGGGIYTKAADVGADLVGKVEAGIPEDDARNPATIADNVGDNVGDVAGMGADLYESYYGSILATMALGVAAAFSFGTLSDAESASLAMKLAVAPMALAGVGILCSILGVFVVKADENASFAKLLKGLHMGVYVASGLIIVGAIGLLWFLLGNDSTMAGILPWWRLVAAIVIGLISGNVIAYATEYYTSYEHKPTQRIAEQALTGPATVIIAGIAEGMKSTWASLLVVVIAIIGAFAAAGGGESFLLGLYGVGIAAVGMLSTLGITLATDAYGPIADNAGGNAEMTGQPPHVRERTDMLDSLGNTTAATGKGFAIGSAALPALALFAAYIQIVQTQITSQAEGFLDKGAYQVSAEDGMGKAIYQGYGKFAVITLDGEETYLDGGMLLSMHGEEADDVEFAKEGEYAVVSHMESHYEIAPKDGGAWSATIVSSKEGSVRDVLNFYNVSLANPKLLGGIFIGVLLAFLFCALTMNAVGRAAYAMMGECRRQFGFIREALRRGGMAEDELANPDNWPMEGVDLDGHHYPDYANCVSISTTGAQKEMVIPSALAIIVPILVGLTLSVPGVMGLLAGGLTSGFAVAVFMANAGGAWDNAKKLLESYGKTTAQEMVDGKGNSDKVPAAVRESIMTRAQEAVAAGRGDEIVYGKGSEDHKATVVGDTVGDPFKDTSGPALNILIKLISIVSVVFAGLIVAFGDVMGGFIGI